MYASLRVYSIAPDAYADVGRAFMGGLVNPICTLDGFQAYILAGGSDRVIYSLSAFDTRDQAEHSNAFAKNWIDKNLNETIPVPPEITVGRVAVARQSAGVNRQDIRYFDNEMFK